jgi:hypothetical protein
MPQTSAREAIKKIVEPELFKDCIVTETLHGNVISNNFSETLRTLIGSHS